MMVLFKRKKSDVPSRRSASESSKIQEESTLFQRGRTLTGSLSSSLSSPAEHRAGLKSTRVQTHHLRQHRRRLGMILIGSIVAGGLLYGLLQNLIASVTTTSGVSSVTHISKDYRPIIQQYFASRPVERISAFLNQDTLLSFVQQQAPEVQSIQLTGTNGFGNASFRLTFRRPVAVWLLGSEKYYVDANGVAFRNNQEVEPSVSVVDQTGATVGGTPVVSNRFLSFIGQAVALSNIKGLVVKQVMLPAGTARQIQLMIDGYTYPVKLSIDRSVGEQIEDMSRALAYLRSNGQTPQYLDVRTSRRAFYQ